MLPNDPIILLSYINTKLRDECKSLDDFCEKYEVDKAEIIKKLKEVNYTYNSTRNQFV
jgi:hypothetical protein